MIDSRKLELLKNNLYLTHYKGGSMPKAPPPPPPTPQTVNDMAGDALDTERERLRKKKGRSSTVLAGTLGESGQSSTTLG